MGGLMSIQNKILVVAILSLRIGSSTATHIITAPTYIIPWVQGALKM